MTLAIWVGDDVGLQKQATTMEGVFYAIPNDNFDRHFSKYGFAYPLKRHELDYAAMVEKRLPVIPDYVEDSTSSVYWMLVDHHGDVWQVDFFMDREDGKNRYRMSIFSIPAGKVESVVVCDEEIDLDLVSGFVKVCHDKQKIADYVFDKKLSLGNRIHWLSRKDIVERLNRDFPIT